MPDLIKTVLRAVVMNVEIMKSSPNKAGHNIQRSDFNCKQRH